MRFLKFSFLLLFLVSTGMFGQKSLSHIYSSDGDINKKQSFPLKDSFEGDVYLFDKWDKKGYIYTDANSFSTIGLNYNIKSGYFEIKVSKDSIFVVTPNEIKSIKVEGNTYKYDIFNNKKYSQVLFESPKISFYKNFTLIVKRGSYNPLNGNSTPNEFTPKEKYGIVMNMLPTENFSLNKKNILKMLFSQKDKIESYIKQNKLSYKKENDIVKIFQYYNTL